MKIIKYLFAGMVIYLVVFLPISSIFWEASDELRMLLVCFGLMMLLSILNYKESIEKIKNIAILNVRFTRGLAYCLISLPFLFDLLGEPHDRPLIGSRIMVYFLVLIVAIFNYGIEAKQTQ